jgi:hypothetical protein
MEISRVRSLGVAVLLCVSFLPAVVSAQSSFTGTVRDTSGGVLPGVTVEAASPALIEKSKSVVTDENGTYRRSPSWRVLAQLLARRVLDREA